MSGIKVLVTGGRSYDVASTVWEVLGKIEASCGISLLVHGDARGADTIAKGWAEDRKVRHEPYPAQWYVDGKFDRGAGHKRNQKMFDTEQPDLVVAFRGGKGTKNMVKYAYLRGCPVLMVP